MITTNMRFQCDIVFVEFGAVGTLSMLSFCMNHFQMPFDGIFPIRLKFSTSQAQKLLLSFIIANHFFNCRTETGNFGFERVLSIVISSFNIIKQSCKVF